MSNDLFAAERRFEVRTLYVFQVFLAAVAIVAIMNFDWWLLGICIISFFLNGLIGSSLAKNKRKSMAELAQGSAGESSDAPDLYTHASLSRSSTNFSLLVAITLAAMALVLNQSWIIVGAAVVAGLILGTILCAISRVRF